MALACTPSWLAQLASHALSQINSLYLMETRGGPGADFITFLGSVQGVVQIACVYGLVNNSNGPKPGDFSWIPGFLFLHE